MAIILKQYKDIDLSFGLHPVTKDVAKRKGIRAIAQAIKHIVVTSKEEWISDMSFGMGLWRHLLGEPSPDELLLQTLETKLIEEIERYEPRAEIRGVKLSYFDDYEGVYVRILFTEKATQESSIVNITLRRR